MGGLLLALQNDDAGTKQRGPWPACILRKLFEEGFALARRSCRAYFERSSEVSAQGHLRQVTWMAQPAPLSRYVICVARGPPIN